MILGVAVGLVLFSLHLWDCVRSILVGSHRVDEGTRKCAQPPCWRMMEPYLPDDLAGSTVLDLGGNAGYFSIKMKQRGAGRCILVDPYSEFLRQA